MTTWTDLSAAFHSAWIALAQGGEGAPKPQPGPAQEPAGFLERLIGGNLGFPLMIGLIILVFYFLVIRPESRRTKSREAMIRALKKGDGVVTSAGIIGKVHRVDEREVVLLLDKDSGLKVRFLKSAISEVVPEGKAPEKGQATSEPEKEASASGG